MSKLSPIPPNPKVSIITVCYNSAFCIKDCIESVKAQDYLDIEHIIIDGNSSDKTVEVVKSDGDHIAKLVSEPDRGIYDAMNKGLALSTGDIIGILNADDFYPHHGVIARVVKEFQDANTDTIFGDLVYVAENDLNKTVRFFPGKNFHPSKMRQGLMPPHPTFFVRKELYEMYGDFDTSYRICADFDFMVRVFIQQGVSYSYIPEVLVKMRSGGTSTQGLKSTKIINQEMLKACKKYGISTSLIRIYSKYFGKIFQLIRQPSNNL